MIEYQGIPIIEVPENFPDIQKAIYEYKSRAEDSHSRRPVSSNWASNVGDPCERRLVYEWLDWDKKDKFMIDALLRFDEGNMQENKLILDIKEAGMWQGQKIDVIEEQKHFRLPKELISGKIDGIIAWNGKRYVLEIKSMSPVIFNSVKDLQDLQKYVWTKKYVTQLQLYLYGIEHENGILLLKDKSSGQLKQFCVKIDYELINTVSEKMCRVNEHVKAKTYPDRMEYNEMTCGYCPFEHICMPDEAAKEVDVVVDPEIIMKVMRMHEIKPIAKEYDDIGKEIKTMFKGKPQVIIGRWCLSGKYIQKKEYTVPAGEQWQTRWSDLTPNAGAKK